MTAFSATFTDVVNSVIAKMRLDATADLTKTQNWVNEVYTNVAVETRCFVTNGTATMTSGASSYTVPAPVLHLEEMYVTPAGSTEQQPLQQSGLDKILRLRGNGAGDTGPSRYYALVGTQQLEFWPPAATGDVLTIYYSYLPAALSGTDVPLIAEPFGSKLLEYGACVQAAEFKADLLLLGSMQQQYAAWMQAFQRYVNRRRGQYPLAFPVYGGDPRYLPHDPSSDWYIAAGVNWR